MNDSSQSKKRILSGIKPTGNEHLGNYLGAMKHWPLAQSPENEVFFFIADLHSLNTRIDPQVLRSNTLNLIAWLLALGIDSERNPIFIQSQVSAHSELSWILSNYTTMGELQRMTQYKDKAQKAGAEGQLVALFTYPVLMAADILLYDVAEVPVGEDQVQHVELTRDIAQRFNNLYGDHFALPKFVQPPAGARVMMLDEPSRKMSKSEGGEGCIYLLDDEATIRRKVQRSVTDSVGVVNYDKEQQPGIANLLEITAAIKGVTIDAMLPELTSMGYGDFKQWVADALVADLLPLQGRFKELRAQEDHLVAVAGQGSERASRIATQKLNQTKQLLGLL